MPLKPTPTFVQKLISALIGFALFVVVPVLVTALLPVTWLILERGASEHVTAEWNADGYVSATAYTCVLFVVPWRVQRVAEVTGIATQVIRTDRTVRKTLHGKKSGSAHADGVDALIVHGQQSELSIEISPASSVTVKARAQAFLQDRSQRETRLFVIANWKFGLGMGLPLTLAAGVYLIGTLLAGLRAGYRILRAVNAAQTAPGSAP
jgi:hypothetical protein